MCQTDSFCIAAGTNITISEYPRSKNVRLGELVNFTCAIQAQSQSKADIRWHMRVPAFREVKDRFLKLPLLQKKWAKHGITISNISRSERFAGSLMQCETIIFIATREMNGASMECAAIDTRNFNSAYKYCNSNFAMLTVESEGVSGIENSSFKGPENAMVTSASETDTAPHSNSLSHILWSWTMLSMTLIPLLCKF